MLPAPIVDPLPQSSRVVEVGVGGRFETVRALQAARPDLDLVVTDLRSELVEGAPDAVAGVVDDAVDPRPDIYEGAALIYSVRPGEEMQPALARLCCSVRATLALAPLNGELVDLERWMRPRRVLRGSDGRSWHVYEPK